MTNRPPVCLFVPMGDEALKQQDSPFGLGPWYEQVCKGLGYTLIPNMHMLRPRDPILLHNPGGFDDRGGMRVDQVLTKPEAYQRGLVTLVQDCGALGNPVIIYLGTPAPHDETLTLSRLIACVQPWLDLGCSLAFDATASWQTHGRLGAFINLLRASGVTVYPETNDRATHSIIDSNWYAGELAQGAHVEKGSIILPYGPSVPTVTPAWLREVAARGHIPAIRPHELAALGMTLDEVWAPDFAPPPPDFEATPPDPATVPATPIEPSTPANRRQIYARLLHPETTPRMYAEVIVSADARYVTLEGEYGTVYGVPANPNGGLPSGTIKLPVKRPGMYRLSIDGDVGTQHWEAEVGIGYEQDWFVIDRKHGVWTPDDNDALNTLRGQNRVMLKNTMIGPGAGASYKVKPGRGTDAATRAIWAVGCTIYGVPGVPDTRVDAFASGEWGGGVWYENCETLFVNSLPADLRMIRNCRSEFIGSDAGQNCPLVVGYEVRNLRKPPGSDAHPDLLQGFFKVNPGAVFWQGVTNMPIVGGNANYDLADGRDEIYGQSLFLRCQKVDAFIVRDWRVNARPEWKSQIKGVDMDYLELRDIAITGQEFLITNDGENGRNVIARRSLVQNLSASAVRVEPGSGVVVP